MRVVLLTNILNPFRIFFYDKLRDEYAHHNVDFRVLVMVPNEPGRTWQYDDFRRDYTTLMKGGLKKVSGIDVIINPGIGRVIKKMNPDVMVCAGSYMLPSVWAAIGLKKKCNYKVFYWSESHLNEKRSYGSLKLAVRSFFRNTVISRFDGFWYAGKMSKEFIDPAAKTVLEIVENFSLENNALNGLCCLRLVYRKTLQQPPEFLPAQAPHLCFCSWPLKAARLYTLVK